MNIKGTIEEILTKKSTCGGIRQVYFSGCGGSYGAFYPSKMFLEKESLTLKTGLFNSGEFVQSFPRDLGQNTLLVIASHKGNTPETIEAARIARSKGAEVIALTWLTDSEIVQHADHVVQYTFGKDKDIAGEKTMVALLIAVEVLHQTEGYAFYPQFMDGINRIDRIVKTAREQVRSRASRFAEEYKNDKVIYTMASGAGFGAAYMESICIFMEMQWINSASIHSGEYFHGPFEITDAEVPFVIQISEGSTRALDERALSFLKRYAKRFEVVDAKELGLATIDQSVIDYFNHSLFNNVYPVYNEALAAKREHPLTTRRYMWRVEY